MLIALAALPQYAHAMDYYLGYNVVGGNNDWQHNKKMVQDGDTWSFEIPAGSNSQAMFYITEDNTNGWTANRYHIDGQTNSNQEIGTTAKTVKKLKDVNTVLYISNASNKAHVVKIKQNGFEQLSVWYEEVQSTPAPLGQELLLWLSGQ